MPFRDPFAAYNAKTNLEAHIVREALLAAGINAEVIEDVSMVGLWLGGTVGEIHKPQVWIERDDIGRAAPVLTEYDRRSAERWAAEQAAGTATDSPVAARCDRCGAMSEFPSSLNGTVQLCPHCRAHVDVGDFTDVDGWDVPAEEG